MIPRDLLTRHPTWEELEAIENMKWWTGPIGSGAFKRIILERRIDAELYENAARRQEIKVAEDAGLILVKGMEIKREADRLDEERVTLYTMRRLEEVK